MPTAMTFTREPQHDQAVQQHGQRGRAFHRASCPALWLLEPQVLFAVVVQDFDAPTHRVPADDLFGGRVQAGGIERFLPTPTLDRLSRHHAEWSFGRGVHLGDLACRASIASGVGSRSPRWRGRPFVLRGRSGRAADNRASFTSRLVRSQLVGKQQSTLWPP